MDDVGRRKSVSAAAFTAGGDDAGVLGEQDA